MKKESLIYDITSTRPPITSINRIFGITPLSPTGNHNICKIYLLCAKKLIIIFYYIDTSVLLENISLVKFIKTTSGTRVVYFP